MLPRIQYAPSSDGVSIAFWAMGDGVPIVLMYPPGFSNIQYEWDIPEFRETYETVSQWATVVRFDHRNHGLSERGVADVSMEAYERDLCGVLDRLELTRAHIFAATDCGKVAIDFAFRNPERVASLTLFRTNPGRGSSAAAPGWSSLAALLKQDWQLFTNLMATALNGLDDATQTARIARYIRESVTADEFETSNVALAMADVQHLLPEVKVPVLVLHRMDTPFFAIDRARQLVATIPDARLSVLSGKSPFAWDNAVVESVRSFVLEVAAAENRARFGLRSGTAFRTILFTDIEQHGDLLRRLGDSVGRALLREHERITREALRAHGGSEVKSMGDGFLASFGSAQRALECAITLQKALHDEALGAGADGLPNGLRVRVGINAGEPIAEDDDLFGTAVIAAARVAALAEGGEILVANVVRELVAGKGFLFNDRGEQPLRGLEDPVRIWQLRW
jgi:class 3 adenylate cyclase/pimeloyl-ACP methyl ester carboxylesterase